MKKIQFSFMKELKNSEFASVFANVSSVLNLEDAPTAQIAEAIKRIKFHEKELQLLNRYSPKRNLTQEINEKLHLRTKYLASLRMEIKAKQITYLPEKRKAANRLMSWIELYKKDLYKPSATSQTGLVNAMMKDREKNSELQQCIALLDLDGLLDEIKILTDEISEDILNRSKVWEYDRSSVEGIRDTAYSDFSLLISTFEVAYGMTSDEKEIEELRKINSLIYHKLKDKRAQFRSDRTRNKNRKAVKAAVDQLIVRSYRPVPAQRNLPPINYKELTMTNNTASYSEGPKQTAMNTTSKLMSNVKNRETSKNFNTTNGLDALSKDKIEQKEDDGKRPPLSKN